MSTSPIKCAIAIAVVWFLVPDPGAGKIQLPASASEQDVARMAAALQEARDLQATQLSEVPVRLAPLLAELRSLQESGKLSQETAGLYQEALLLQISTQTKLLAPEDQIAISFRELLLVNPVLDDSGFNPREKLLMEKVRSAETGRLSLETEPPGASLLYAGMVLGTTPFEISLIAGRYPLRLTKEGYLDQEITVSIQPSEIFLTERTLRRRAVEIPLSTNVPGTSVRMNGREIGKTEPFDVWIASLAADRREAMRNLAAQWGGDTASAGFFHIPEVNVGEAVSLEFQAPCYRSFEVSFTIQEAEVDWDNPILVRPELRRIELRRDTGFMEVTSVPEGAEVWIDGALVGKTPLQQDICTGAHTIQVLHSSGQYRREVVVQRDQISKIAGEIRPALLFLGMYGQDADGSLRPVQTDWEAVARQLILRGTAFVSVQVPWAEVESMRRSGKLPLEALLAGRASGADSGLMIRKIAADNGHVDLLLFGMHTGGKTVFQLFNTIHSTPDRIEVPRMDDAALSFLVSQLNRSDSVSTRLILSDMGIEVFDSPYGLAIQSVPPGLTDLSAGSIVRAVDQKPMSFAEFHSYMRAVQPGQQLTLDIESADGKTSKAILPVASAPAEYPWSMPDGFANAILTMLHSIVERDPLSDLSKFASLSLARGLMETGEWKLALEYLARTNLEPRKSGICPGTVLYYQGRCYEALSDHQNALRYYTRAKDYPNATLGTKSGVAVPVLADWRIQSLKRQPQ